MHARVRGSGNVSVQPVDERLFVSSSSTRSAMKRGSILVEAGATLAASPSKASTKAAAASSTASSAAATAAAAAGAGGKKGPVDQSAEAVGKGAIRGGYLKKRRETDTFRKRWCILRKDTGLTYYDTKTRRARGRWLCFSAWVNASVLV